MVVTFVDENLSHFTIHLGIKTFGLYYVVDIRHPSSRYHSPSSVYHSLSTSGTVNPDRERWADYLGESVLCHFFNMFKAVSYSSFNKPHLKNTVFSFSSFARRAVRKQSLGTTKSNRSQWFSSDHRRRRWHHEVPAPDHGYKNRRHRPHY